MNGKASADETVSSSSSSSPSEEENDSQRSAKPGLTSSSAATTRTELPGGLKGGAKKTGTSFRQRFIQQQKLIEARRADFSGVKNELVYTSSSSSSASASTCSSLNVSKDDLITSLSWSIDGSEVAAVAYNSVHDWNGKFLELLERSPSLEKLQLLYRHAQDFLHTAEALGRIIINERHLPNEQKIIPPFTSGVAGGEKFLSHGIWFKYAVDVLRIDKKGSSPPTWMYGIDAPDDEKAMKSGGHELKGSIAFMDAAVQDLDVPLMVLIDYLGFRLVAIAQLPISAKTIVYGTADAGESIHNSSPQMDRAMRTVAERLNLQPHQVGHHIIAVPADIEGHIGRDGKNYVIDFARVFPPEGIPEQREGWDIRSIFYKLLRPELVRWNKVPLSSDAFSGFQRMDRRASKYNKDVNEATERLFASIIPSFARKIYTKSYAKHFITFINDSSKHNESLLKILEQAKNRDTITLRNILTDSVDQNSLKALIVEMHKHGINVRHIGRVRHCFLSFLSSPWHPLQHNTELSSTSMIAKTRSYYESRLENEMSSAMNTLLLVEMVVRVVKCIFRKHLRHPSRGSIRFEVLKLLNLLFCGGSPSEGMQFWENDIKNGIRQKFGPDALFEEEMNHKGFLFDTIFEYKNIPLLLLQRLCEMTGIRLSSQAWVSLSAAPTHFHFLEPDLKEVGARVKYQTVVDVAEGKALFKQAAQHSSKSFFLSIDQAASSSSSATSIAFPTSFSEEQKWRELHLLSSIRLLDCAKLRFESAMSSNTESFQVLYYHGRVLLELEKEVYSGNNDTTNNKEHQRQLSAAVKSFEEAILLFPYYQAKRFNDLLPNVYLARAKFHLANALSLWGGCKVIHVYNINSGRNYEEFGDEEEEEDEGQEVKNELTDRFSKLHSSKFTPQHFFRAATKLYEEAILQSPKLLGKLFVEAKCWFNRVALMREVVAQTRMKQPPRKGLGMLEVAFHQLDFILQLKRKLAVTSSSSNNPPLSSSSASSSSFSTLAYLRKSRREILKETRQLKSSSVSVEAKEEKQWRLRMVITPRDEARGLWHCRVCAVVNCNERDTCIGCSRARSSSSPLAPLPFPVEDWTCQMCTFINSDRRTTCEMCETAFVPLPPEAVVEEETKEEEEDDDEEEKDAKGGGGEEEEEEEDKEERRVLNAANIETYYDSNSSSEESDEEEERRGKTVIRKWSQRAVDIVKEKEKEDEEEEEEEEEDEEEDSNYDFTISECDVDVDDESYALDSKAGAQNQRPASARTHSPQNMRKTEKQKEEQEEEETESKQQLHQALHGYQEAQLLDMLSELKASFFLLWSGEEPESNSYKSITQARMRSAPNRRMREKVQFISEDWALASAGQKQDRSKRTPDDALGP